MNKALAKPGDRGATARQRLNRIVLNRIVRKSLIPRLLYRRTAGSSRVCAIELTAAKFSDPRVTHGHGAENAGETKRKFDQPRVHMELPMKRLISRFVKDESGATAIEYGLIAAGIALAIIAVVNGIGTSLNAKFASINTSLK